MGYRSEVNIITTLEGLTAIKLFVAGMKVDYNLMEHTSYIRYNKEKNYVRFGWYSLKWYSGYDEVKAVTKALNGLLEAEIPYIFCRIGENSEDIEYDNMDSDGVLPESYTETETTFIVNYNEDKEIDLKIESIE
ncbi:MAG TPA: hypothetical protein VK190_02660 [Pseudoneobacillus sp.]|nr:hypothetical protein [Pseudoneobacillus sp.]